jgi:hypothetical protein
MPRHDPGGPPHVRTPDGRVRGRHLLTLAVICDRCDLHSQVGGDIGCRPPLGIEVSQRHAPKDTAVANPRPFRPPHRRGRLQAAARAGLSFGNPRHRVIRRPGPLGGDLNEIGYAYPGFAKDALDGGDAKPVDLAIAVDDAVPVGVAALDHLDAPCGCADDDSATAENDNWHEDECKPPLLHGPMPDAAGTAFLPAEIAACQRGEAVLRAHRPSAVWNWRAPSSPITSAMIER